MNYSDQILQIIEHYASIFLTISEIADIIECPPEELREDIRFRSHPASQAYRRGKLKTKVALHEQEVKLAQIGSPLAVENSRRHLQDMEDDE
ncbi:MAG: hypothetical protein K2M45_08170 [Muribaculaceae bacterium]|nr:hypothetical protein [Muribaculaceae bacterium]